MDLDTLGARLHALEREYQQRTAPLDRRFAENLKRVNKPGGLAPAELEREMRSVGEQVGAGEGPLHALLAELCPAYLKATGAERDAVRRMVQSHRSLPDRVRGYAVTLAKQLRSRDDAALLDAALAAMSLENCAIDYRDTLLALAELYVRAERAGIDPRPHFDFVAGLSSTDVPRGGRVPLARTLRDFHSYAVVAERRRSP
jgi:hypothetical protein